MVVKNIVSPELATIMYLQPRHHCIPLPADTEFRYPAKRDLMDTDVASVFDAGLTLIETNRNPPNYTLSTSISVLNKRYAAFAQKFSIPQ